MPNYPGAIQRRNSEKHGERASVLDFGANADLRFGSDGVAVASDTNFTSSSRTFTERDPGKAIWIEGAGPGGTSDHLTRIVSLNSEHSVELASAPAFSVAVANFRYGTDNLASIQRAMDSAQGPGGIHLDIPRGAYGIIGSLTPYSNLALTGRSYCHNPHNSSKVSSQIVGLADLPVIAYTDPEALSSFHMEKVTLRGTARSGSKGVYLSNVYGVSLRDCTFDYFGDQGLHIAAGVDGRLEHLFAQNVMLVRSGRSAYVGGIDVLCHDCLFDQVLSTTSIGLGTIVSGQIGDGYLAGLAIRGVNCFVRDSFGHLSQVGIYVADTASLITFVNTRADLNQGAGWVIDASGCQFVGVRAHQNGIDTDGTYSGYLISGGGNKFTACHNTYNGAGSGPAFYRVKHAFETTTTNSQEANHFVNDNIGVGSHTDEDYMFTGTQQGHVIVDCTNLDPNGTPTLRVRGDVSIRDKALVIVKPDGPSDEKVWRQRLNYGVGFSQLWQGVMDDAYSSEEPYLIVHRSGATIGWVRFPNGPLEVHGGDLKLQHDTAEFVFTTSGGTPRAILADYGGTGNRAYTAGNLLVGDNSGGLTKLAPGTGFLNCLSNAVSWLKIKLTDQNHVDMTGLTDGQLVKRSGNALATSTDYYTKTEVDTLLAGKATAGATTSGPSAGAAHTHLQT